MDCSKPGNKKIWKNGSANFLIRIIYQNNTSWQGEVRRLDNNKKMNFRSLMELMMLMQEAVADADTPNAEYSIRSWNDNGEELLQQNVK